MLPSQCTAINFYICSVLYFQLYMFNNYYIIIYTLRSMCDCVTYDTLLIIVLQKEYYHVFAFTCTTLIHIFVFSFSHYVREQRATFLTKVLLISSLRLFCHCFSFFTIYTKLKSSGKTIKSGVLKIQTNSSRDTIIVQIVDPGASMN